MKRSRVKVRKRAFFSWEKKRRGRCFWRTKIGQCGWNVVDRETIWDGERGGQGLDHVPGRTLSGGTEPENQKTELEGGWKPRAVLQALPLREWRDFPLGKDHHKRRVVSLSVFEELWAVDSYQPTQYIFLLVKSCLGLIKIQNPVFSSPVGLWFSRTAISYQNKKPANSEIFTVIGSQCLSDTPLLQSIVLNPLSWVTSQ